MLTEQHKVELFARLTKDKPVHVISDLNCSDCAQLAQQIKAALREAGFTLPPGDQSVMGVPQQMGVSVTEHPTWWEIRIGPPE